MFPPFSINNSLQKRKISASKFVISSQAQVPCTYSMDQLDLPLPETIQRLLDAETDCVNCRAKTILSIDLVLQHVLNQLALPDLLQCSLVNRAWQCCSRSILARYKKCYVKPLPKEDDLNHLQLILNNNRSSLPYNGLILQDDTGQWQYFPYVKYYYSIISQVELKHLFICGGDERHFEQAWKTFLRVVQKKTLNFQDLEKRDVIKSWTSLNNLKTVTIHQGVAKGVLVELLECAPNLKELGGDIRGSTLEYLLEKQKQHLIKEFRLIPISRRGVPLQEVLDDLEGFLEFAMRAPKLRVLVVRFDNYPSDSQDFITNFQKVLHLLVQSSRSSLDKLDLDHLSMYWLATHLRGTCTQVRSLAFSYDEDLDIFFGFTTLEIIDFGRVFPNLIQVEIRRDYSSYLLKLASEHISDLRNSNDCHQDYVSIPCARVTTISVLRTMFSGKELQILQLVFPNAKNVITF